MRSTGAPGLLSAPTLRPRRDLLPIPQSSSAVLGNRSRKAVLVGELVGALLAHAEELSDLDQADTRGTVPGHSPPRTLADRY
jgi:hypothetical protein